MAKIRKMKIFEEADRITMSILQSQLAIEKARSKGFSNLNDSAVYWIWYSTGEVIKQIEKQITTLKNITYV